MADATTQALCTAAMRKLRVVDPGETPNPTELDDFYQECKRMLKSWAVEGLSIYASTEDTHTLTAGTSYYTIGSGGTIDTGRPIQINDSSFVRANGLDNKLRVVGERKYQAITQKSQGSDTPAVIWYKPEYPLGIIYLWPPGGGELHLWSRKHLTDPATVAANAAFPEEFQDAIVWNLACRMAPEFIGDPTPYQMAMATYTLKAIKKINEANDPAESDMEICLLGRNYSSYNIDGG